jgi:predicted nucleic acid-binding protein
MTRPVVLLDTGPLVAALSRNDHAHAWAKSQFAEFPAPFLTCEPVISEACFLLRQLRGGASGVSPGREFRQRNGFTSVATVDMEIRIQR